MQTEPSQAFTARMPVPLYDELRRIAEQGGVSINQVVLAALERYVRQVRRQQAIGELRRMQEEMRAKYGVLPDSTPLIRQMREADRADLR